MSICSCYVSTRNISMISAFSLSLWPAPSLTTTQLAVRENSFELSLAKPIPLFHLLLAFHLSMTVHHLGRNTFQHVCHRTRRPSSDKRHYSVVPPWLHQCGRRTCVTRSCVMRLKRCIRKTLNKKDFGNDPKKGQGKTVSRRQSLPRKRFLLKCNPTSGAQGAHFLSVVAGAPSHSLHTGF